MIAIKREPVMAITDYSSRGIKFYRYKFFKFQIGR